MTRPPPDRPPRALSRLALSVGFALVGCGGDAARPAADALGGDTPPPDVGGDADAGGDGAGEAVLDYIPCDPERRVGGFEVALLDGYTSVDGRVATGFVPQNVRVTAATDGLCRLALGRTLTCEPGCTPEQTCGEAGACIPYPTLVDLGVVAVSGLSAQIEMTPNAIGSYSSAGLDLPHPGFAEGDPIALAAGGAAPAFILEGRGVAPMVPAASALHLTVGEPLAVAWTPGAEPSARMRLVLDLAHHGGVAASVECDGVPDEGAFELPAALVSALVDEGLAGFPTLTLTRRTADSIERDGGCLDLSVTSSAVLGITLDGLTSCTADEECPPGTMCQFDLSCR